MKTTMQEFGKRVFGAAGKMLFLLLFTLGLAFGASAQRGTHAFTGGVYHGGGFHTVYYPRTYVVGVGVGYGFGWGLGWGLGWGYPGWYGPMYAPYPPYYYGYGAMPPQLSSQINGIRDDYKAQIKDVKHDKALSKSERDEKINQLEQQRDAAITQARHDFYNNSGRHQNNDNNVKPGNGNSSGASANDPEHPEYTEKGS